MTQPDPAPLLAFGAHPDDIEFGCGAVIALEASFGRPAHLVVCSRGEAASSGTPALRTAEAQAAAAILGASLEFSDLCADTHFERQRSRAIALARIIRRVRPTLVLAPTTVETQHPDHAVLGRLVRDAARLARYAGLDDLKDLPAHAIGQLFFYAVTPGAEPRAITPVLVDVSAPHIVEQWTRAMRAHASQSGTRHYVELQLTRARLLGLSAGIGHAQALFPCDAVVVDSLSALHLGARAF